MELPSAPAITMGASERSDGGGSGTANAPSAEQGYRYRIFEFAHVATGILRSVDSEAADSVDGCSRGCCGCSHEGG